MAFVNFLSKREEKIKIDKDVECYQKLLQCKIDKRFYQKLLTKTN